MEAVSSASQPVVSLQLFPGEPQKVIRIVAHVALVSGFEVLRDLSVVDSSAIENLKQEKRDRMLEDM